MVCFKHKGPLLLGGCFFVRFNVCQCLLKYLGRVLHESPQPECEKCGAVRFLFEIHHFTFLHCRWIFCSCGMFPNLSQWPNFGDFLGMISPAVTTKLSGTTVTLGPFGSTVPSTHPITVTTRIIHFLVGNPYKPSFATWVVDVRDQFLRLPSVNSWISINFLLSPH